MSELGRPIEALWALNIAGQLCLLTLLIRRKAMREYPAFGTYVGTTVAQDVVLILAIQRWGFQSLPAYRIAWIAQGIVLTTRALAVGELCRHVLRPYRGIWALAKYALIGAGGSVFFYALLVASHQLRLVVMTVELGLELAIAGVIVMLLLFVRYYLVPIESGARWLAIGLCLYACIAALNDTVLERQLGGYVTLWNELGMISFFFSLLIWIRAVRLPAVQTTPVSLYSDAALYLKIVPEVNVRLRLLNERLMQFWRLEAPNP